MARFLSRTRAPRMESSRNQPRFVEASGERWEGGTWCGTEDLSVFARTRGIASPSLAQSRLEGREPCIPGNLQPSACRPKTSEHCMVLTPHVHAATVSFECHQLPSKGGNFRDGWEGRQWDSCTCRGGEDLLDRIGYILAKKNDFTLKRSPSGKLAAITVECISTIWDPGQGCS